MRARITLEAKKNIKFTEGFNQTLHSLIYNHLQECDTDWLLEYGVVFKKRTFNLFVFSSFLERGSFYKKDNSYIFPNSISFMLSSPVDWVMNTITQNLMQKGMIKVGDNELKPVGLDILEPQKIVNNTIDVRAVSPITVYRKIDEDTKDERLKFFSPFDEEFSRLISKNLQQKWIAFYGASCPYTIEVEPLFKKKKYNKTYYFKENNDPNVIKGWMGDYKLSGDMELLQFAFETGLGYNNNHGFGMIEAVG